MTDQETINELYERIWQLEKDKQDLEEKVGKSKMYNELTDVEKQKIAEYTMTDYGTDLQLNDSAYALVQGLLDELDHLSSKIDNMQQDIADNYKPIDCYELYGIRKGDF